MCSKDIDGDFNELVPYSLDSVKAMLSDARQKSERISDICEYIKKLKSIGFVCNDIQKQFIIENAGVELTYGNAKNYGSIERLTIDPLTAAQNIGADLAEEYEEYTHKKFLIVGFVPQESLFLYVADDGSFYGCNDYFLVNLGRFFEECLYRLINKVNIQVEKIE